MKHRKVVLGYIYIQILWWNDLHLMVYLHVYWPNITDFIRKPNAGPIIMGWPGDPFRLRNFFPNWEPIKNPDKLFDIYRPIRNPTMHESSMQLCSRSSVITYHECILWVQKTQKKWFSTYELLQKKQLMVIRCLLHLICHIVLYSLAHQKLLVEAPLEPAMDSISEIYCFPALVEVLVWHCNQSSLLKSY